MWSRVRSHVTRALTISFKTVAITGYIYCVYYTVTRHVMSFILLEGDSMVPTLNASGGRDVVLVECFTTQKQRLKRDDIIIAKQPDKPSFLICKRISALEGDSIPPGVVNPSGDTVVPRGQVWLLGDNTKSSYDSRHFGPLPYALIQGRVFYRVWPISKFGRIT